MMKSMRIIDRIAAQSFRFMPTNWLSRTWGMFSRTSTSRYLVLPFSKVFRVQTAESELAPGDYPTFNSFFTRRLKSGLRPVDLAKDAVISPVDGLVSAFGRCDGDQLLQVKGIKYTLFGLLRDGVASKRFANGHYATMYLSPRDYHRAHAPLDLSVSGIGYMPGVLMPVNGPSVRWIDNLYTQNERVMLYADSPAGMLAIVLVGAHCVGSISLTFNEFVTNRPGMGPARLSFKQPVRISKGEEIGVFEMGSTAIMLFEPGRVHFEMPAVGSPVRMGQRIGSFLTAPSGEHNLGG